MGYKNSIRHLRSQESLSPLFSCSKGHNATEPLLPSSPSTWTNEPAGRCTAFTVRECVFVLIRGKKHMSRASTVHAFLSVTLRMNECCFKTRFCTIKLYRHRTNWANWMSMFELRLWCRIIWTFEKQSSTLPYCYDCLLSAVDGNAYTLVRVFVCLMRAVRHVQLEYIVY